MWRSAHTFCMAVKCLSELKKHHQDCLMSSAQSFYGPCSISSVRFIGEWATPPLHVHPTSRYSVCHCTCSVLPDLPRVSTASNKRWGEKSWLRGYLLACSTPSYFLTSFSRSSSMIVGSTSLSIFLPSRYSSRLTELPGPLYSQSTRSSFFLRHWEIVSMTNQGYSACSDFQTSK